MRVARWLLCFVYAFAAMWSPAHAQSVGDFYKGKNLDLYIGYSVGGGYDIYARLSAAISAGTFPANPTVIPKKYGGRR